MAAEKPQSDVSLRQQSLPHAETWGRFQQLLHTTVVTIRDSQRLIERLQAVSAQMPEPIGVRPGRSGRQNRTVLASPATADELRFVAASLQRERNFIADILDAARDLLVVVLDRDGRILEINPAAEKLIGYSAREMIGRSIWEIPLIPEESDRARRAFKDAALGKPQQIESWLLTKDRQRRLIAWSCSLYRQGDSVSSVIATGIDRTELAEAMEKTREGEATMRALLETAAQAIVAINREGQIVLANGATAKMFSYDGEELIGMSMGELVPKNLRAQHAVHRARWFANPRSRPMGTGMDLIGVRKDGTEFPIEVSLSYLHNQQGMLGVAFISDVTERRKSQAAILEYQEQLRRLTASLIASQENESRKLARELHDVFSQELAALGMEISALQNSGRTRSAHTQPGLEQLAKRVGRLADGIHRASRQLHPVVVTELGLMPALREECNSFTRQFGIPVKFISEEIPHRLPDEISLCLYRVAQESLRNVHKHANASEVRLTIRLTSEPVGICMRIEDKGDGFDPAKARKSGGLGLISMEERVRLVEGTLTVDSQPGIGTSVEVQVPLKK